MCPTYPVQRHHGPFERPDTASSRPEEMAIPLHSYAGRGREPWMRECPALQPHGDHGAGVRQNRAREPPRVGKSCALQQRCSRAWILLMCSADSERWCMAPWMTCLLCEAAARASRGFPEAVAAVCARARATTRDGGGEADGPRAPRSFCRFIASAARVYLQRRGGGVSCEEDSKRNLCSRCAFTPLVIHTRVRAAPQWLAPHSWSPCGRC